MDGRVDVTQRLKRRPTIFDKLEREPTMQQTQMWDIGGVRARLPSLRHLQAVSRRLKKTWTIVRTKDYIAEPRNSGYRAMHHVVRRNGRLIEVQLRTVRQDAWANQVEDDNRAGTRLFINPRQVTKVQGDPQRGLKVWLDDEAVYIGIIPS